MRNWRSADLHLYKNPCFISMILVSSKLFQTVQDSTLYSYMHALICTLYSCRFWSLCVKFVDFETKNKELKSKNKINLWPKEWGVCSFNSWANHLRHPIGRQRLGMSRKWRDKGQWRWSRIYWSLRQIENDLDTSRSGG